MNRASLDHTAEQELARRTRRGFLGLGLGGRCSGWRMAMALVTASGVRTAEAVSPSA